MKINFDNTKMSFTNITKKLLSFAIYGVVYIATGSTGIATILY